MKIYDCFVFYNELIMLEIRLNELAPVVDKFVLVEAKHTFSGKPKRLYYDEVKDNEIFAAFKDKIIHLVYDGDPKPDKYEGDDRDLTVRPISDPTRTRRIYECMQRNTIGQGLFDAEPDDIIIGSDVDEIVNPDMLPFIKTIFTPCRLNMKMFYYYFNCRVNRFWPWAAFCRFRDFVTAQDLRLRRHHKVMITNSGWHFGELMPPDKLSEKLGSICHAEYDNEHFRDVDRIRNHIEANEDIYERPGVEITTQPFEGPRYITDNKEKYKEYIKCCN